MVTNKQNLHKVESIVRRIIAFYIDSVKKSKANDLILYLGGGKIPEAAVKVLTPILESLTDEDSEFGKGLTRANFAALERLRDEVEALYKRRAATRKTLKEAINSPQWSKAERAGAARFNLKFLRAEDRVLDLLAHEVVLSDFTAEQIISTFHEDTASVTEFSGRWYADCNDHDYGEEWDPAEGNQQEDNPPGEVLGMAQGFMVSNIILYLYAANVPDGLVGFFKRRKMPQGKKVAKDVLRVFRRTKAGKS